MSIDKTENLDGFRLRIHDPVLANPEPFVEGMFHPSVPEGGRRRDDLDKKIRDPLDILLGNEEPMLLLSGGYLVIIPRFWVRSNIKNEGRA